MRLGAVFLWLWLSSSVTRASVPDDPCVGERNVTGIDVSSYQGEIDWKQVRGAGVTFAFARAADGTGLIDERFAGNYRRMKRAGLRRGAYQVFRASVDPKKQADLLLKLVLRLGRPDLPLVADVETDDGQPPETLRTGLRKWLRRIETRTGRRPIIYTSPSMSDRLGERFGHYHLWVAHYEVDCPTVPDGWRRWAFWQHSSKGQLPGISGPVDLDHFAGTIGQLRRFGRARLLASAGP